MFGHGYIHIAGGSHVGDIQLMATLSKRADARQRRLLRIIEGAVKNTIDAHPDWREIDSKQFARSIAKRAVGTLSSQFDEVLALSHNSVRKETEKDVTLCLS